MALDPILGHEPVGVLKLSPPNWGLPRLTALLVGYLAEIQAFETALQSVIDGVDVDTCERYALEGLAAIVGEPSRPSDTEELRGLVKARILVNRSNGQASDVATLVRALSGADGTILENDLTVRVLTDSVISPQAAPGLLDACCAAGVHSAWLEAGTFALPDIDDPDPPTTGAMGVGTWSDLL